MKNKTEQKLKKEVVEKERKEELFYSKMKGKTLFGFLSLIITLVIGIVFLWNAVLSWRFDLQNQRKLMIQENERLKTQYQTTKEEKDSYRRSLDKIEQERGSVEGTKIYSKLISQITALERINSYDRRCEKYIDNVGWERIPCKAGNVRETDISEIKYSEAGKFLLAIIPGQYGGSGFKLIKYDIQKNKFEIAKREDIHGGKETKWFMRADHGSSKSQKKDKYQWFAPPFRIDSYAEGHFKLTGGSGDAGCWVSNEFDYDVEKNYIKITKSCSACDMGKEECEEY